MNTTDTNEETLNGIPLHIVRDVMRDGVLKGFLNLEDLYRMHQVGCDTNLRDCASTWACVGSTPFPSLLGRRAGVVCVVLGAH